MNHHPSTRRLSQRAVLHSAVAAAVLAITMAGCTWDDGGGEGSGARPAVDAGRSAESLGTRGLAQAPADGQASARGPTAQAFLLDRDVIQRADLAVRPRDVGDALTRVRAIVAGVQGVVADEHTETGRAGEPRRSTLTLRVPADAFDTVLQELDDLGRLGSQQISTEDVSTEVVDVQARIVSAERTLRRIRQLLEEADDFSDVLSLESELARREADLASLKAQQAYLEDQTSLSTITLTLLPPRATPEEPEEEPAGFVAGLAVGWDALVGLVTVLLTALGVLAPLLLVLVPVGVLAWWAARRLLRRPGPVPAPEPPAS
ncbi:MAG TPA: DUF4349 domain-containing protein [Nocardioidaceae bacterium]|nr:DUF4349 domain-containing protein [Nocardioidaceae bacterium]